MYSPIDECTSAVGWLINECTSAVGWLIDECTSAVGWLYQRSRRSACERGSMTYITAPCTMSSEDRWAVRELTVSLLGVSLSAR